MHTGKRTFHSFVLAMALILPAVTPALSQADTRLEFLVKEPGAASSYLQTVTIKAGMMLAKGAGGDPQKDLFFDRATEQVTIIDHRRRTVMVVDERRIDRLGQQARTVQPVMQGIAQQFAKLSEEERARWQALVGDSFSLAEMARASAPPPSTSLLTTGWATAAGVRCQTMRVMQGGTPVAELCVAEGHALTMPADDIATVRALWAMYERIAPKVQRLASQFGLTIPVVSMGQVTGIPIAFKDLSCAPSVQGQTASGDSRRSVTLHRMHVASVAMDQMRIPTGYATKSFTLW